MSQEDKFGLELVQNSVSNQTKNGSDAVVVLAHWRLLIEGLRCCGEGEVFSSESDSKPSELLPSNWNSNPDVYQLKYRHRTTNEKFVLKAVPVESQLTAILMRVGDEKTQEMNIDLNSETETTDGKVEFKNVDKLIKSIEEKLIRPFFPEKKKEEAKTDLRDDSRPRPPRPDPDNYRPERDPPFPDIPGMPRPGMPDMPYGPGPGRDPFFDPLGQIPGSGEMLFDRPGRRMPQGPPRGGMGGGFPGGGFPGGGWWRRLWRKFRRLHVKFHSSFFTT